MHIFVIMVTTVEDVGQPACLVATTYTAVVFFQYFKTKCHHPIIEQDQMVREC
jgi:hypothetical protein